MKVFLTRGPAFGLLLIRTAVALIFIGHGWAKLANLAGTLNFFQSLGLPASLAYVVAVIEFFGGLALLLGLWPRVMALLLAVVMVGAVVTVKWRLGFLGGYEFEFLLFISSLALALTDSRRYGWRVRRPVE